jgi:hypothetical protein
MKTNWTYVIWIIIFGVLLIVIVGVLICICVTCASKAKEARTERDLKIARNKSKVAELKAKEERAKAAAEIAAIVNKSPSPTDDISSSSSDKKDNKVVQLENMKNYEDRAAKERKDAEERDRQKLEEYQRSKSKVQQARSVARPGSAISTPSKIDPNVEAALGY